MVHYEDSYSPSYIVRQTHRILHLDSSLKSSSNTFDITYASQWNDYTKSLLPVPIICGILAIVAVIAMQIGICCRSCFRCCKCIPSVRVEGNGAPTAEATKYVLSPYYSYLLYAFVFFALLTIGADQLLVFGSHDVTNGVHTGKDGLDYVYDLFTELDHEGNDLNTYGTQMYYDLGNASTNCTYATDLQDTLTYYFEYVDDYLSYVEPVAGKTDDVRNSLDLYGIKYKNATVWVLYGMVMVCIAIYCLGLFCKSTFTLKLGIGITEIVLIALFVLVTIEMATLMGSADYCMYPIDYVNDLVPRSISDVTAYYTTCNGTNPFQSDIDSLNAYVDDFYKGLNALEAVCPDNTYIDACYPVLANINSTLQNITDNSYCPPTQEQIADVLESGICDDSFKGVYTIWIGQYVAGTLLLITTIIVSYTYHYYDEHWRDPRRPDTNPDQMLFVEAAPSVTAQNEDSDTFYYNSNSLHSSPPLAEEILVDDELRNRGSNTPGGINKRDLV